MASPNASGYVGQGLLHDPEDVGPEAFSDRFGQRVEVQAAERGLSAVEVLNKRLQTCGKSDLVQDHWPQGVRNVPDLPNDGGVQGEEVLYFLMDR